MTDFVLAPYGHPGRRFALALAAVLLLAATVRLVVPESTWFTMDQTRDIGQARTILGGEPARVGPAVGQTGIHLGPLHYWVTALGLAPRDEPGDAFRLVALLNALGVAGWVVVLRRMIGARAAIAAGLLLALHPLAVLHGRALWNPALILPTTALFAAGLLAWSEARSRRGALVMWVGAALMLQAHATTVLLLPLMLRGLVRRAPWCRAGFLIGVGLFLLLTLPWLVPAASELWTRSDGLRDLSALSRVRAEAGPVETSYLTGVVRALTVERVLTARTLFGGDAWNRIVEVAAWVLAIFSALGAIAFVRRGGSLLWFGLPVLLLPCAIVPLLPHFAYYYYLELTWPMRAAAMVCGAVWVGRRFPRLLPGVVLAVAFTPGVVHLAGGLWRDHTSGLLRGHLVAMDLRARSAADAAPHVFPSWAAKRAAGQSLARYPAVSLEWVRRNGRGPWWSALLDDGGFWINEARRRGGTPIRLPAGRLYIGHVDDTFPRPREHAAERAVTAGFFDLAFFTPWIEDDRMRAGVPGAGGAVNWVSLPADLDAWNLAAGDVRWPADRLRLGATLDVPESSPLQPRLLVFLIGYGGRVDGMRVDDTPLRPVPGGSWSRLGFQLTTFLWRAPTVGRHRVAVDVLSPDDRRAPVWFELYDFPRDRGPPAR